MNSLILGTAAKYLLPLLLLFSVYLFLRGHNDPGGGFVGGLVASAAVSLYAFAYGVPRARRTVLVDPRSLIGVGLLVALTSGLIPLAFGEPLMTGMWLPFPLPVAGTIGTPVTFDLGVYLLVLGVTLTIVFGLAED